ncbi:uncharacterized protein KY384_008001 [Bacidia gigantensis]|uniref:uncharacterized protein n=1 Tax=Bacidia gigantensis TaxID=2732470 RepID=UPI001D04F5C4|nr:uncharacterized protein KY384_008001 [Bacidia gigantensis]KAG8527257.1 hypothetical protein KY384_008001 [Bacidia gigantensis]
MTLSPSDQLTSQTRLPIAEADNCSRSDSVSSISSVGSSIFGRIAEDHPIENDTLENGTRANLWFDLEKVYNLHDVQHIQFWPFKKKVVKIVSLRLRLYRSSFIALNQCLLSAILAAPTTISLRLTLFTQRHQRLCTQWSWDSLKLTEAALKFIGNEFAGHVKNITQVEMPHNTGGQVYLVDFNDTEEEED